MAARTVPAFVAAALLFAGCTGSTDTERSSAPVPSSSQQTSAVRAVPSALDNPADPAFPDPLINLEQLVSGGPPPDGIPPINQPNFQLADTVDWLTADEPVLSLTVSGETRAYPVQTLTWHEIVNDAIGGEPVAVTYCPLCNSGVAFHRRVAGEVLNFGTSGLLYGDNLVMYDRQTQSLWPQLTGQASVGVMTGTQLTAIPMGVVGWDQFVAAHPEALVLTQGRDPRLPLKERVIGIRLADQAVAIPRKAIADTEILTVTLAGREIVLWHEAGQRSALDDDNIRDAQVIGTFGAFDPRLRGRRLTFSAEQNGFSDDQTGSTWNVLGEATAGPLQGRRLQPITHLDTFWFAWVAFQSDTTLHP